ncbi:MAG: LruC domain-containing protein, partial [Phocaeicola sp.]
GYKNVHGEYSEEGLIDSTLVKLPAEGEIRPYLYNGSSYVIDANYNTGAYPYVLIIPSTNNADKEFKWCKEGVSIEKAYNFAAPRTHDWYLSPKDLGSVVDRTIKE